MARERRRRVLRRHAWRAVFCLGAQRSNTSPAKVEQMINTPDMRGRRGDCVRTAPLERLRAPAASARGAAAGSSPCVGRDIPLEPVRRTRHPLAKVFVGSSHAEPSRMDALEAERSGPRCLGPKSLQALPPPAPLPP